MTSLDQATLAEISDEYTRLTHTTLNLWQKNPTCGHSKSLPYGYSKFGLSVGNYFDPSELVNALHGKLLSIGSCDANAVLVPRHSLHFTYFAITNHLFSDAEWPSGKVTELKKNCHFHFKDENWHLDHLRLVPGPNFLLLAGLPSMEQIHRRNRFVDGLLSSSWRNEVHSRHANRGYPFPPLVWHTTLCRYQHEFFPKSIRDLFLEYKDVDFGSVSFAPPELRLVNYDWSTTTKL